MLGNRYSLIFLGMALAAAGCGGEQRNSASVAGKVTIKGQPAADIIVRFQPVGTGDTSKMNAGMGSYGKTNTAGEYTLQFTDDDRAGAIIGEHKVTIDELTPPEEATNDAGGIGKPTKSRIPAAWSRAEHKFMVKDGNNEANFELSE